MLINLEWFLVENREEKIFVTVRKTSAGSKISSLLIGFFFVLIIFSALETISRGSLTPFGFIGQIYSQAGLGRPAPNSSEIVNRLTSTDDLNESFDFCQIIDPNRDPSIRTVAEYEGIQPIAVESLAGLNLGPDFTGGYGGDFVDEMNQKALDLGMSYTLGIFTDPSGAGEAAQYVRDSVANDLVPVVRLCFLDADAIEAGDPLGSNACNFTSAQDIIDFYRQVSSFAGAGNEFIAMVGPNEPRVEVSGFLGTTDTSAAIDLAVDAANGLQDLRVASGGNMYLSPGAFNLTETNTGIAAFGDGNYGSLRDVDAFTGHPAANTFPDIFDYIMGNVYAETGELEVPTVTNAGTVNTTRVYHNYYQGAESGSIGLGQWAEDNEMPVILTEFGIFEGRDGAASRDDQITEAIQAFEELCNDESILGVMFFRPIEGLGVQQPEHFLTDDEILEIIGDCAIGGSAFRDYAWINCNFDSCLYTDSQLSNAPLEDQENTGLFPNFSGFYDGRSVANACGRIEDRPEITTENAPALFVECGAGSCVTRKQITMEIAAPIKQFGQNAVTGTSNMPFVPTCVEAINYISDISQDDTQFDPFNQFAGEILLTQDNASKELSYPMPWLGSAINCSSALFYPEATKNLEATALIDFKPHPGSSILNTREELEAGGPNDRETIEGVSLLDEFLICQEQEGGSLDNMNCFDKRDFVDISHLRTYNATLTSDSFAAVEACEETGLKYRIEENNYIIGPEVVVEGVQDVYQGSDGDLCADFGKRKADLPSPIVTRDPVEDEVTGELPKICVNKVLDSELSQTQLINQLSSEFGAVTNEFIQACSQLVCEFGLAAGSPVNSDSLNSGECIFNTNAVITSAGNTARECFDRNGEVAHDIYRRIEQPNGGFPERNPDLLIPGMYDALYLQYMLMRDKLSAQNLQIVYLDNIGMRFELTSKIRDGSRLFGEQEYWYGQQLNGCTVPELMNNNHYLARANPERTTFQYFDWLGYLDVIQELRVSYLNSTLPAARERPLTESIAETIILETEPGDSPRDIRDKEYLEQFVNDLEKPMLFSNIAEYISSASLLTCDELLLLRHSSAIDPEIRRNLRENGLTCLSRYNDPNYRGLDRLGNFLCSRGYTIPDVCDAEVECSLVTEVESEASEQTDPTQFLVDPTQGNSRLTFRYGEFYSGFGLHNGIDYVGSIGIPIVAAADGRVIGNAFDSGGYGNFLILQHDLLNGRTIYTLYAHLQDTQVSLGQPVVLGQQIGTLGNTGNSTAPHLHFEVRHTNCPDGYNLAFPRARPLGQCTVDPLSDDLNDLLQAGGGTIAPSASSGSSNFICEVDDTPTSTPRAGQLACNVSDMRDTADLPDLNNPRLAPFIEVFTRAYNLDTNVLDGTNNDANRSHSWVVISGIPGAESLSESQATQAPLRSFLGDSGYEENLALREDVTSHFFSEAIRLGINPRFAFALWYEETAGSAIGRHALGCLYTRGTGRVELNPEMPFDGSAENMKTHLTEQLECLASYVDDFPDFNEWACVYSGEVDSSGALDTDCTTFTNNPNFPVNLCARLELRPG